MQEDLSCIFYKLKNFSKNAKVYAAADDKTYVKVKDSFPENS